ncbi:BolA family protein [Thiohalobacter thiocyanaticus]|uniref:BolA/IbaG family iron-sulfur metabolism protein n=1 Tax=Thiohalobacter thiocyanaticus TaxID=585455 RepID=A0A426QHK1_9GAMM|nr:BolA/IbaG family iron-sulfur metabolism protein [Thiohalobacter thiocyanaticus]RRQ21222.1 BolA/IbaG family iron-sulfur metabolism protein [Thiohalobacter thiocyanaticus]
MQAEDVKQLIEKGLPDAEAIVTGDGDHFEATVISPSFADMNMVKQHQAVYRTLGDGFQGAIHALALKTYTPEQWAEQNPEQ